MRGKHIVLEGIDGAGTTTQRGRLAEALSANGYTVHQTAEPSSHPVGALIRQALQRSIQWSPDQMALAVALDRLDHVRREIQPALDSGAVVLSDRYVISSLVYQSLELPLEWVTSLNQFAPPADLTLLVDLEVSEAEERRAKRGGPDEIFDDRETQERLRASYLEITATYPNSMIISGSGTVSDVTNRLLQAIEASFSK